MEFADGVGFEMSETLDIVVEHEDSSASIVGTCRFDENVDVDVIVSTGGVLVVAFVFNKRNSISETMLNILILASTTDSGRNIETVDAILLKKV